MLLMWKESCRVNEAYALLEQQQFDLGIFDLNLPDKSGLELIHEARRMAKPPKILAVTGALSDLHLQVAKYMGADIAVRKYAGQSGDEFADDDWVTLVNAVLASEAAKDERV